MSFVCFYFYIVLLLIHSAVLVKVLWYRYLCFLRSISVHHPYYLLLSFSLFLSILHFLWQFLNVFTNSLFGGLVLSIVVPCVLWLTLSLIEGVIKKFWGFDATFFVNTELTYLLNVWANQSYLLASMLYMNFLAPVQ